MLRGYPLTIRNSDHRQQLLQDARYYNLRGLEQKLIPHARSYSIARQVSEIVIRLQDIKPSQIAPEKHDDDATRLLSGPAPDQSKSRYITYSRPYMDETPYHLIVETSSASAENKDPISLNLTTMRATLFGATKSRITNLFQTVANKLNLPTTIPLGLMMMMGKGGAAAGVLSPGSTPLSEDEVKVVVDGETHILLDGRERAWGLGGGGDAGAAPAVGDADVGEADAAEEEEDEEEEEEEAEDGIEAAFGHHSPSLGLWRGDDDFSPPPGNGANHPKRPAAPSSPSSLHPRKRARFNHHLSDTEAGGTWSVHRAQWRLRVQPRSPSSTNDDRRDDRGKDLEIVMVAVKLEATSGEKARNAQRAWLE
ncbi:MAG: hypothetical protein Q9196_002330 [Gyalolechia fulgens]